MSTDRDWEKWGATDPYFGVISSDQFHKDALSEETRREFFATGVTHIDHVMAELHRLLDPAFAPESALDFGCGVGRLLIPLAHLTERVTGVDISPSMRAEAMKNCEQAGVHNVSLVESDDTLSQAQGSFDLIHSDIVLQHIPWRRGHQIIQALAEHVAPQGCMALQVLTACNAPVIPRTLVKLRYVFPPANWLRNLLRSRPMFEPAMQLHVYDPGAIHHDLERRGFTVKHVDEAIPNFRSTQIYAQRVRDKA